MSLILAALILSGPPQPSGATVPLKIHLGKDWRSAVIRSELKSNDEFFLTKRLRIEASYRLVVDEDSLREPTYEVGRGDERHRFRAGSFSGSGAFITALASIAAIDRWERGEPFLIGGWWATEEEMADWTRKQWLDHRETRPEPFPPEDKE